MRISHRILLCVLAVPLLVVVIAAAAWTIEGAWVGLQEQAFLAITQGATRQEVTASLGTPTNLRPCGDHLWWGDDSQYRGTNDGQCITEARYEYFLVSFGVGYSSEGKVVSKYKYVSD